MLKQIYLHSCKAAGLLTIIFVAMLALKSVAHSQVSGKAFEGFKQNSKDPIQIEADSLQVLDGKNKAIFKGRVKVRQGSSTITTNLLTVSYGRKAGGGQGDVERLDLSGNVTVTSGANRATADKGSYVVKTEDVLLVGNVLVSQGNNVARGCKLVANLKSSVAELKSCKKKRIKMLLDRGSVNKN